MAFGQASGPPASAAQLAELLELLERAGFDGFREARHPYGLTQRQSNGKFTRGEADELIERLTTELEGRDADDGVDVSESDAPVADALAGAPGRSSSDRHPAEARAAELAPSVDDVVLAFPDEVLADELRRRGWACIPPPTEPSS